MYCTSSSEEKKLYLQQIAIIFDGRVVTAALQCLYVLGGGWSASERKVGVYLFSQAGCSDVVATSEADNGVSIQGARGVTSESEYNTLATCVVPLFASV